MQLTRANLFVLTLAVSYLLPLAIPGVGLFPIYFFITVLVLFAWFLFEWSSVKAIQLRSAPIEVAAGLLVIGADYFYNWLRASSVGILDLIVLFLASVVMVFGFRGLRRFWVPATYGIILILGYQLEAVIPNYEALQNWLAGIMAGGVSVLGIGATVSGHVVYMNLADGTPVALDVSGACTGLQGILAFGLLSTMTLLDFKPRLSRLIPIFAIGFLGAFLVNIVRLLVVFLTFEYAGISAGTLMHVYFGYIVFIGWVMVFWAFAFKYLAPPRGLGAVPAAAAASASGAPEMREVSGEAQPQ